MFKKFFGKKNDGFFLQLEDENASSKPEAKAKAKPAAVVAPPAPVAVATTTNPVALGTTATIEPATKADKTDPKTDKKAVKAEKKSAKKAESPKVVTAPAPVVAAPAAPKITNFATDYLIKPSSISGRRLPGANMKGFLELARQVEKPRAFKASASERKVGEK